MLWPKKNSYKEFDIEKNSCSSKIPLPPITFLMVGPLPRTNFVRGVFEDCPVWDKICKIATNCLVIYTGNCV